MSAFLDNFFKKPIYVHILTVGVFLCIIIYIVLKGLDSYTNHNQAVYVPDVIGLQIEEAEPFFTNNMLRYIIVDSIFSKDVKPGAIVKLMPESKSKVKKNRIVYVTVNAKTEETASIPDIEDMSFRQAYALLRARGFMDVEWKYVTGEYRDLTIGVSYGGKMIKSGTRVPMTAKLILIVGDGNNNPPIEENNEEASEEQPAEVIGGDESWF